MAAYVTRYEVAVWRPGCEPVTLGFTRKRSFDGAMGIIRNHANELLEVLGLQGIGASPERLTVKKRVNANIGDVLLDDAPFDFIVGLTGRTWLETLTATERAEYEQAEYRRKLAEYNAWRVLHARALLGS